MEVVESAEVGGEPVTVVASVASVVRLVGCTTSLGTEPVEADPVAVISDTMLLKSDVRDGSNPVWLADPVADSTAESDDCRLVGCTTSLGTEPVEAEPVAVISDTILLKSEVRGSPPVVSVLLALVTVVSIELALGVTSEEMLVVAVSVSEVVVGASTVVSETVVSETVVLSAVVAVVASSAVVVEASSSVAVVLEAVVSSEETMAVLDVTVVALSVSDCPSDAVVIKAGPDGPRLDRMSDNERC